MTYNSNIPQAADQPTVSQSQLLTNFQQLNTVFGNNHVTFDAGADNGKHSFCQFPEQGADPATAADEGAVYTKEDPISNVTDLFFRRESSGVVEQLTGIPITTVVVNGVTINGITTPWGLILNWGNGSLIAGNVAITWAVPYTTFQSCVATKFVNAEDTTNINCHTESAAGISFRGDGTNAFRFFAIGI